MEDQASSPKLFKSTVNTDQLKPGDHVTGSDRMEIMISQAGLYVEKTLYDKERSSPTAGCTLVWWKGATNPEAFNPYFGWYVDNRDINGKPVVTQGE